MASAQFLNLWLPAGRQAARLYKISLTIPSALTLQLSTREVSISPDGNQPSTIWQEAIDDGGSVTSEGEFCGFDPRPSTAEFRIMPRRLGGQAAGLTAIDLFSQYTWHGATVTIYQYPLGLNNLNLANIIFNAGVVIDYHTEDNGMRVYCQMRNAWNGRLPLVEVTKGAFPRAPAKSLGLPVPIALGDLRDAPARPPANPYDVFQQGITSVAGMRRAGVRGVVTLAGQGGAAGQKGQVLFASHACAMFNNDATGSTPAIEVGGHLADTDPNGPDVFNGASGTGFNFADIDPTGVQPFKVFLPIYVTDSKQPPANPADNGRAATDPFNDTSYTALDFNANKKEYRFPIPDVSPQGELLDIKIVAGYLTSAGATHFQVEYVGTGGSTILTCVASTVPTSNGVSVNPGNWAANPWNMGSAGHYLKASIITGGAGETARLFFVGLAIVVRPTWPVVTPASSYKSKDPTKIRVRNTLFGYHTEVIHRTINVPATERVDATFLATLQGQADDGGGTYTGVASALIQRVPDLIRYFLAAICGDSAIETGVGVHGSFIDARAACTTWRDGDMLLALGIDDWTTGSDVLRQLARSALVWPRINRFSGKWELIVWRPNMPVDFPRRLTRYDLLERTGPKVMTHRDSVLNDIAVTYGRDAWQRKLLHEVFAGPKRSSSGYFYRSIRDGNLTVLANLSDRIDCTDSGGAHTASLTPGFYAPIDLANHAATQLTAVAAARFTIGYGFEVKAGYNDKLDINDGAAKTATLTAGPMTGTQRAADVQARLNAVSTNWTCTYSAATRLLTITRSAGAFNVLFNSGPNVATSCCAVLGFDFTDYVAGPITSSFPVEVERYTFVQFGNNVALLWETGANGINAATPRTAGELFGFDLARDRTDGAHWATAESPKADHETRLSTSVSKYGTMTLHQEQLEATNDTDTAREILRRLIVLYDDPPPEIQFTTEHMPDLEAGMVFDFDNSVDQVQKFPVAGTDGSWAGKVFICTHVTQHSEPAEQQEVVAFYVPPS